MICRQDLPRDRRRARHAARRPARRARRSAPAVRHVELERNRRSARGTLPDAEALRARRRAMRAGLDFVGLLRGRHRLCAASLRRSAAVAGTKSTTSISAGRCTTRAAARSKATTPATTGATRRFRAQGRAGRGPDASPGRTPRALTPGRYRTYLAPAALAGTARRPRH